MEADMFAVTTRIVVAGAPDAVFRFVADQANAPRWQSGLQEVRRVTAGPIGVGTEHEFTRIFAGRSLTTRNRFVRYEPGRLVEFEVPEGWLSGRASYTVEPAPGGTCLISTMEFTARGAWRVLEPILRRLLLRDAAKDGARLAAIFATDALPDPAIESVRTGERLRTAGEGTIRGEDARLRTARLTSAAGLLCAGVALVGVVNAIFIGLVPPQVAPTTYSFPLATGDFAFMQGFLVLLALGIAVGILGVRWSGAAPGRAGRVAALGSTAGFVVLAALQVVRIAFAGVETDSPQAAALSGSAFAIEAATGATMIALGCIVVIRRHWTGWRAWLPVATGVGLLAVAVCELLAMATITRAATCLWLGAVLLLGLTVRRAGARAMADAGARRVRPRGPITVAALLSWFNAVAFGIPSVIALVSVLGGGALPTFFGFESFGGGPFDSLGPTGLAVLLALFALVCVGEAIAGTLLWRDRRSGRILTLALLPIGVVLWWGFAVPLPALNAVARTILVLVGWKPEKMPNSGAHQVRAPAKMAE
jgi:hypothetical protein